MAGSGSRRRRTARALRVLPRLLRAGLGGLRGRPRPLSVSCVLTHRCDLRCTYCAFPLRDPGPEMTTAEWIDAIDAFCAGGALRVGLSGGEPLLRSDLGALVRHARLRGCFVTVNTNGRLLPERIDAVRDADRVVFSLDGAAADHDAQRAAPGNFEATMVAIETARRAGLQVATITTLTARNAGAIEEVLGLAEALGFEAGFHPVAACSVSGAVDDLLPPAAAVHGAATALRQARRGGGPVLNSDAALATWASWPRSAPCRAAGRWFCAVDPAGRVFPCHFVYTPGSEAHLDGRQAGWRTAAARAAEAGRACPGCWITPLAELNRLAASPGEAVRRAVQTARGAPAG